MSQVRESESSEDGILALYRLRGHALLTLITEIGQEPLGSRVVYAKHVDNPGAIDTLETPVVQRASNRAEPLDSTVQRDLLIAPESGTIGRIGGESGRVTA